MIIDVHAHLNDDKLIDNIEKILEECKSNKVEKIICVGYDKKSSKKVFDLAQKYDCVYSAIGIHPSNPEEFDDEFINFARLSAENKKVVAIGEIGLDYHYQPFDKNLQKEVFIKQLELAKELKLPVQIHCRDAMGDLLEILKENKNLLTFSGIVHCFSGDLEDLKTIEDLGLKISVGGVLTFKNAKEIQEVIKNAPVEMLTLETDCPYLTPHPHRSKTNDPSFIPFTAEKIALLKEMSYQKVIDITTKNALDVFKKLN